MDCLVRVGRCPAPAFDKRREHFPESCGLGFFSSDISSEGVEGFWLPPPCAETGLNCGGCFFGAEAAILRCPYQLGANLAFLDSARANTPAKGEGRVIQGLIA